MWVNIDTIFMVHIPFKLLFIPSFLAHFKDLSIFKTKKKINFTCFYIYKKTCDPVFRSLSINRFVAIYILLYIFYSCCLMYQNFNQSDVDSQICTIFFLIPFYTCKNFIKDYFKDIKSHLESPP